MKKNQIIIISSIAGIILILVSCIIQKMPHRPVNGDGSALLTKEDSLSLRAFSPDHTGKSQDPETQGGKLFYEEITHKELGKMIPRAEYTWIFLWATWCPHCYVDFPRIIKLSREYKNKDVQLITVCQDYDIPAMTRQLKTLNYYDQAYILNPALYDREEWKKIKAFGKQFCPACPPIYGTPNHFIFNRKGELLFHQFGEMRTPDTLAKIFR